MIKRKKKDTAELIIDASRILFNENSERKITTNHIASYLSMSPGNLYYYFSNKNEIIFEIFKRYKDDLENFLKNVTLPENSKIAFNFVSKVFDIMWNYRFFFREMNVLLSSSEDLKNDFFTFTSNIIEPLMTKHLNILNDAKIINMDEDDIEIFIRNCWIVTKYWYTFCESRLEKNEVLSENSKYKGARQVLGMIKPFVNNEYKKDLEYYLNIDTDKVCKTN